MWLLKGIVHYIASVKRWQHLHCCSQQVLILRILVKIKGALHAFYKRDKPAEYQALPKGSRWKSLHTQGSSMNKHAKC